LHFFVAFEVLTVQGCFLFFVLVTLCCDIGKGTCEYGS